MEGSRQMIVTVTLNPAIDKTIAVDRLVYQGLNRIQSVETDIGGKGINVSKTIAELGGKSVATGFLGGHNGQMIDCILKEQGIF
jgi:1-phosphofructokinase